MLNGLKLQINPGERLCDYGPQWLRQVYTGSRGCTQAGLFNSVRGDPTQNQPINEMEPEEVAQLGLFLGFQYPVEIPGVSNMEFLKASSDSVNKARSKEPESTTDFMKRVRSIASSLDLDQEFLKRGVNEGFSGGEKRE